MITIRSIYHHFKTRYLAGKMLQENLHGRVRFSEPSVKAVCSTWKCNGFRIKSSKDLAALFAEARRRIDHKNRQKIKSLVMQLTLTGDAIMDDLIDVEDFTDWLSADNDNVDITWGLSIDDNMGQNVITMVYTTA